MAHRSDRKNRRDPYAVLGVARDADADEIKAAYRKLARELHPDVSELPDAEERFKEVTRAHHVLSDSGRREAYDEFGEIALDPGFDAEKAREMANAFGAGGAGQGPFGGFAGFGREQGFAGFDTADFAGESAGTSGLPDWLGDLLGGLGRERAAGGHPFGASHGAPMGLDLEAELEIDFRDAALGCERRLTVTRPRVDGGSAETETLRVRIPPGVADGGRIRLAGKGAVGMDGESAGDLHVRMKVRRHPYFWREGRDLHIEVPINISEALLGAEIEVPTLEGRAKLTIPAGTDGGTKLRLRGVGIPAGRGAAAGDLYVRLRIRVAKNLDDRTREAAEALADAGPAGLRDAMLDEA